MLEKPSTSTSQPFKIPYTNAIHEVVGCEEFAKDANNFMKAVGEDNIFSSGLSWLTASTGISDEEHAKAKRKMVRKSIDCILMQIYKAQTQMNIVKTQTQTPAAFNKFVQLIIDELRYIETQMCQVDTNLMNLLKNHT